MTIPEMSDAELVRAAVGEVMGWTIKIRDYPRPGHYWLYDGKGDEVMALFRFIPLTDYNHTFMVVEKMRELGWDICISSSSSKGCDSLSRIILEAALKAKREEK